MRSEPHLLAGAHNHFAGYEVGLLHFSTCLPYFNPTRVERHHQAMLILHQHLRLNG
jgi:hypothetical protein